MNTFCVRTVTKDDSLRVISYKVGEKYSKFKLFNLEEEKKKRKEKEKEKEREKKNYSKK